MADTLHLTCRKGVWYYRRRVPEYLVLAIGRRVIQFSLATKTKGEAKKLRAVHDTQWDALFEAAEMSLSEPGAKERLSGLSRRQMEELVRDYVARTHRQFSSASDQIRRMTAKN